ncbi:MAG: OsmC family protein [Chloroflexi bacterium]|nr:OsmC family protein [Chloroflexota bacterium]
MEAKVTWHNDLSFSGTADSQFTLPLGSTPDVGGANDGFRPMELFLVGLAGCTGMDVISILKKKRQDVRSFEVRVSAERAQEHPKVFTRIQIEYIVSGKQVDPAAVERAVELSATKYCPAQAMLSPVVPIQSKITLHEVD